jgi:hypothetical protein
MVTLLPESEISQEISSLVKKLTENGIVLLLSLLRLAEIV